MIDKLIAFAKEHNLGVVLNISKAIYLINENIWDITTDDDLAEHLVLGFEIIKETSKYGVSFYEGSNGIKFDEKEFQTILNILEELNHDR